MSTQARIRKLIDELKEASYAYYQLDKPIMSDREYNEKYDQLEMLEKKTGIIFSDSPTQKVQGFVLDSLPKVEFSEPMLSADKTKSIDGLTKFVSGHPVFISFKLDGLTIVLKYDDGVLKKVSSAKLDALSDIIDSAAAEDKKLVIMARFVPELDEIQEFLEKKKIGYAVVRGGIKDREEEICRFQHDDKCRVFVGQIAAAGLGITLTAASTMVFYSLDYSMSNFEQAKARIHRAGQKEKCHYIYLVCKRTVDGKVLSALRQKQNLAKMLVDDYRKGKNPFRI